MDVESKSDKWK